MEQISTPRDLVSLWPSRAEFADDLGVSVERVHKWAQQGGIRAEFFQSILAAAVRRGLAVTAEDLCRIAATAQKDQRGAA